MIAMDMMHSLIRTFVGYGAPVEKDDVGPNKPDWPFFLQIAESDDMNERDLIEAASRFHKYRNTQLPSILMDMNMIDKRDSVDNFLNQMKKQGEKAQREYDEMREQERVMLEKKHKAKRFFERAMRQRKDPLSKPRTIENYMTWLDCDEDTAIEAIKKDMAEWTPPSELTVRVAPHEDVWVNKWGKEFKTTRLGMYYQYNPTFNQALKNAISFPQLKFISKDKIWSIAYDKDVLAKAVSAIEDAKGWVTGLEHINQNTEVKKEKQQVKNASATLKGNAVVMSWPYLSDPDERMAIQAEVKSTQGRKYNPESKTWSISIHEAAPLIERLRKHDDIPIAIELAESIERIPEIHSVMLERAKRISISGAASLSDEMIVTDMKDKLDSIFPASRELYPFQYVGVRFAELANGRCLIGDDMGVGKTIQAIAHIALNQDKLPALIVCPASVKYNWKRECEGWLPDMSIGVVEGRSKGNIPDTDIVVCNYDIMSGRMQSLIDNNFNIVVFDESHYLKNSKAQRTQASLTVAETSEHIICLSGTAITNRPIEFFTTLNLLRPHEFNSSFEYGKRYCAGHEMYIGRGRHVWNFDGSSNSDELHSRTRDFCIRRLKKEVLTELPDKVRTIHNIKPSNPEYRAYQKLQESWINEWVGLAEAGVLPKGFVLNMLTDLRHECGKMKVNAAVEWIQNYHEITGKPVVVFAHHRDVLRNTAMALKNSKNPLRFGGITGDMSAENRSKTVDRFQNGELDVLFCSTVAAKEGITLTAADTVVFIEREWTPAWEEQAEDRVNRIGQESSSVHAVYLTVTDTIDEKFNHVVEEKRKVIQAVLDGGDMEEREGIANLLIQSMIASGDLPSDFGNKKKTKSNAI